MTNTFKATIIILGILVMGIVGCVGILQKKASDDITDAFMLVEEGLTKSQYTFIETNDGFHKKIQETSGDIIWKEKADKLKVSSDSLYNYIQRLKITLVENAGDEEAIEDNDINGLEIRHKDALVPNSFIETEAVELKKEIVEYRNYLLSDVNNEDTVLVDKVNNYLNIDDRVLSEETVSWESYHFEHLPLMAVITIMTKMQSDIRNTEKEVLNYYYNKLIEGKED